MLRSFVLFMSSILVASLCQGACDLDCPSAIKDLSVSPYCTWATEQTETKFPMCFDSEGHVYIAYADYQYHNALNPMTDIYVSVSQDFGFSWAPPIRVDGGDGVGETDSSTEPTVACDDSGHVYVVWPDKRVPGGDFFMNASSDYGQTFEPVAWRLNAQYQVFTPTRMYPPRLACDQSGNVYVLWGDRRNGKRDVFVKVSHDYGRTWTADDRRLDTYDAPGSGQTWKAYIKVSDLGTVYAVMKEGYDDLDAEDVYFTRSEDHGESWSAPVRLTAGTASGTIKILFVEMEVRGENIYVMWDDERDVASGIHHVYQNRSHDGGATWLAAAEQIAEGRPSDIHATDDGMVHLAFLSSGRDAVYYMVSSDRGRPGTWSSPVAVSSPGMTMSGVAKVVSDNAGSIYVLFNDYSIPGEANLFMNRSCDGGATWLAGPVRVEADNDPEPSVSYDDFGLFSQAEGSVSFAWNRKGDEYGRFLFRSIPGVQALVSGEGSGPFEICVGDQVLLDSIMVLNDICPFDLEYQWMRGGANIPGATQPTYQTPATLAEGEYDFRCRVYCGSQPDCTHTSEPIRVSVIADTVPGDQGNVLMAVTETATASVTLDFRDASASQWRVFRDELKTQLGTTALTPDVPSPGFTDPGVLHDGFLYYYRIKGLSPCTKTPGP